MIFSNIQPTLFLLTHCLQEQDECWVPGQSQICTATGWENVEEREEYLRQDILHIVGKEFIR